MARASDIFPDENPDAKVREIKNWLTAKGVRDLEAVSLFCDHLDKVSDSNILASYTSLITVVFCRRQYHR